jgi:hypothetical protein
MLFAQRNKKVVAAKAQVGARLFPLRLPGGQRLSEFILEFGTSFLERAIEEIIPHVQPAFYILLQLVDIAVFEHAFGKRQLLCAVVNQQRAFDELATIKAPEKAFASKIKILGLKALAPNYTFFRKPLAHFFGLSPSSTNRLRIMVRCGL